LGVSARSWSAAVLCRLARDSGFAKHEEVARDVKMV
jgi:hypothetical protein